MLCTLFKKNPTEQLDFHQKIKMIMFSGGWPIWTELTILLRILEERGLRGVSDLVFWSDFCTAVQYTPNLGLKCEAATS